MKRRDFLKTAAAVAAPLVISRHVLSAPGQPGANDRIRMAGIGIGGRGSGVLGEFLGHSKPRAPPASFGSRPAAASTTCRRYSTGHCLAV